MTPQLKGTYPRKRSMHKVYAPIKPVHVTENYSLVYAALSLGIKYQGSTSATEKNYDIHG